MCAICVTKKENSGTVATHGHSTSIDYIYVVPAGQAELDGPSARSSMDITRYSINQLLSREQVTMNGFLFCFAHNHEMMFPYDECLIL
jgi:hypothetical protein